MRPPPCLKPHTEKEETQQPELSPPSGPACRRQIPKCQPYIEPPGGGREHPGPGLAPGEQEQAHPRERRQREPAYLRGSHSRGPITSHRRRTKSGTMKNTLRRRAGGQRDAEEETNPETGAGEGPPHTPAPTCFSAPTETDILAQLHSHTCTYIPKH